MHWREKGYTTANDWCEFCYPLVLLARFPKFIYSNQEELCVPIEAYNAFYADLESVKAAFYITDDTMLVEHYLDIKSKIVEGSYNNIKVTTPEDIGFAEAILRG